MNYGQRDIPEIIIQVNEKIYNISEYYQEYMAIHHLNESSRWIIKAAILPEGLKESLYKDTSYLNITIKEIHRSCETGDDINKEYCILKPDIEIMET